MFCANCSQLISKFSLTAIPVLSKAASTIEINSQPKPFALESTINDLRYPKSDGNGRNSNGHNLNGHDNGSNGNNNGNSDGNGIENSSTGNNETEESLSQIASILSSASSSSNESENTTSVNPEPENVETNTNPLDVLTSSRNEILDSLFAPQSNSNNNTNKQSSASIIDFFASAPPISKQIEQNIHSSDPPPASDTTYISKQTNNSQIENPIVSNNNQLSRDVSSVELTTTQNKEVSNLFESENTTKNDNAKNDSTNVEVKSETKSETKLVSEKDNNENDYPDESVNRGKKKEDITQDADVTDKKTKFPSLADRQKSEDKSESKTIAILGLNLPVKKL
jgi:hypothetical protein